MTHAFESSSKRTDVRMDPPGLSRAGLAPKSVIVRKLLRRGKGATLVELQDATAWQPHSVRAFLSGMRKKGDVLRKEQRQSGETAYCLAATKPTGAPSDA